MTWWKDKSNSELSFDFLDDSVTILDQECASRKPHQMPLSDFIVEGNSQVNLIIEVTDPSHSRATENERIENRKALKKKSLVPEFVHKARCSYCYMHLMGRDTNEFDFIAVIGIARLGLDDAGLITFRDALEQRIRHEGPRRWARQYIKEVFVLSEKSWARTFPEYSIKREVADVGE